MANEDMVQELVAFLGGGRMGEALASGLIRSGGRSKDDLIVTARRRERVAELAERLGTATTLSNPEAVGWARAVVLTVRLLRPEVFAAQPRKTSSNEAAASAGTSHRSART